MTIYMMTEAQHAQIVDVLSDERYASPYSQIVEALAMLKAMQPVEPVGWWDALDGGDFIYSINELCGGPTDGLHPLYTPTNNAGAKPLEKSD